jgi:hypothetical protein
MKRRHSSSLVTAMVLGAAITLSLSHPGRAEDKPTARFFCAGSLNAQTGTSIPTTFARTKRGAVPVIRWQSTFFGKYKDYTPLKRCEEVSRRFQTYYDNGTLSYLTAGEMNSQNVICVSDEYGGPCQGLLLTLEPKDNPQEVLRALLSARSRAGGPVTRSTGSLYVDMNEFLETTPTEEPI